MFRIIIMTFSLIAVILVNAAANIMPINGKTTSEIPIGYPYYLHRRIMSFHLDCYISTSCLLAIRLHAQQRKS